jgi:hypothetical protein
MDIQKVFELYCGPDVKYASHEIDGRTLRIRYRVPGTEKPEAILTVSSFIRNGLGSSLHWAVRRSAACALQDGYLRSGRYDRDIRRLLAGRLA